MGRIDSAPGWRGKSCTWKCLHVPEHVVGDLLEVLMVVVRAEHVAVEYDATERNLTVT
jgi:hypothetical protein